jgi:nicotinate-nucleotide adenylyltransferase
MENTLNRDRIGLFGGTFNPIHSGHIRAADIVQTKFEFDKILFVPSYIPPHKDSAEVASPYHRLKMIELAVSSFPRFVPSSIEIDAQEMSYSIITLNKIKEINPRSQIFFILGIDAFVEIETWKEYESVLEKCFFIVISRPGYQLGEAKKILGVQYEKLICDVSSSNDVDQEILSDHRILLFSIDALGIASTDVRARIRNNTSIKGLVPDNVLSYIKEHNLYKKSRITK